ncbi:MAG: aminoglycoside phosphotransferase family protein, partial [Gammaproteobacteria bacterium]
LEKGFLLLSDFGNDLYLNALNNSSVYELYSDAINALITMQLSSNIGGLDEYDTPLLKIEMDLFTEWLIEKYLNIELTDNHVSTLNTLFNLLIKNALEQPKVFVHRDFHSRNLMITKDNNPGIIDYQDAVYGPITYDLVSVLKDCYIKWPRNEISKWVDFYLNRLHEEKSEHKINRNEFIRWFDLMGVQRHLKVCGIFARLSNRDGKHNFVKDIPRTLSYILDLREIYSELQPACSIIEELILPRLEEKNKC